LGAEHRPGAHQRVSGKRNRDAARDVRTYSEKATAERVALGVYGVRAVANDVTVRLGDDGIRTDTDIAQAVVLALR
jgi:osmotically-inducible protein OsmY